MQDNWDEALMIVRSAAPSGWEVIKWFFGFDMIDDDKAKLDMCFVHAPEPLIFRPSWEMARMTGR